ncbi:MAG: sigma factor-like helix-turn-helix DNA-binding protein, partial [Verrucomicrobiota bacterium]
RSREEDLITFDGSDAAESSFDGAPSSGESAAAKDELRFLQEAMNELPDRTRIALEMRRFGGYRLKDIAEKLGLSVTFTHELIAEGMAYCRKKVMRK